MPQTKIQQIFSHGWDDYCKKYQPSSEQSKAAYCIMNCKSGAFGYNISLCEECNYLDFHTNSCRNRNCPNCQAVLKELWIDKRSSELIDADYFHIDNYAWNEFKNKLYSINWNAEIKETFNGNGNAIEYLGRYANRIAITNTRIISVNEKGVSFHVRDYKTKE